MKTAPYKIYAIFLPFDGYGFFDKRSSVEIIKTKKA